MCSRRLEFPLSALLTVVSVFGQSGTEVIAPVGVKTLVQLSAPQNSNLSIEKGSFRGSAELVSDRQLARYTLVIVPDRQDGPAELIVFKQGKKLYSVRVFPVRPETEVWAFQSHANLPDITSREYTTVTQGSRPHQGIFNGLERKTLRTLTISGIRVALMPGEKQGAYERLLPGGNPPQDLAELTIYTKELVVGAPIRLPATKLTIYAESIEFQDKADSTSSIDVTPLPRPDQTAQATAGLPGEDAPDVFLYLRTPFVDGGKARVISRGGQGQRGGPPKPGTKGTDLQWLERDGPGTNGRIGGIVRSWGSITKNIHDPLPPGWGSDYGASINTVWFKRYGNFEFGNGVWPGDAVPGAPGGVAGVGGRGGLIHATVSLTQSGLNFTGGDAGRIQEDAPGADPGTPAWAVGVAIERGQCIYIPGIPGNRIPNSNYCKPDVYNFYSHKSAGAPRIPSHEQSVRTGQNGNTVTDLHGWSHSLLARTRLRYAEDLYRIGLFSEAEGELNAIVTSATPLGGAANPESDYLSVVQRSNVLLSRISSNLDYFGHPGGWAPLIDFPTTWALLQSEVHNVAPILIGTEQVRIHAEEAAARKAELQISHEAALEQIKRTQQDIQASSEEIPRLEADAASIAQDESRLQETIRQRESELQGQAQDATKVSFLSGALKTLGAVASVMPVGQPITGAVGGALSFLSSIDQRTPWESISQLPDIAKGFSKQNFSQSVASYHSFLHEVNTLDPKDPKLVFSKISSAGKDIGDGLAQFKKLQDGSRVPQSQVEAILQKLEAEDSSLQNWVGQVSQLNKRKELFQKRLDSDMQMVGELTSRLTSQAELMDTLTSELVSAQDQVDHPAIMAAQDISRSLRNRLEYYYYLFVKAYEYYAAKAYSGDRSPGLTADSFAGFLKDKHDDPRAAAEALEALYTAEIRDAGNHIIGALAEDGGPSEQFATLVLNASEKARLNAMLNAGQPSGDELYIDLEDRGIFREKDLEARLVNVEILQCDCEKASGPEGSVRFTLDVMTQNANVVRTTDQNFGFHVDAGAIPWGASVDLSGGKPEATQSKVPADVGQLIAQIIGAPAPKRFATAPPLYPGIVIKASPLFDDKSGQTKIRINDMSLRLTYTYREDKNPNSRVIRVTFSGTELVPFFFVSARDDRQLQDGVGSFSRIYRDSRPVEIVAPPTLGTDQFDGWYVRGQRVETSYHLSIPPAGTSYFYEARYKRQ